MKALKCKPSAQFAYNYTINVLSKYSNIISHRSSKVDTTTIDLRKSAHRSSFFEGRHIYHRSSILEGRHNDRRSSKVDTSIIDLRRSTHRPSKIEGNIARHRQPNITPTIRHRILSTTDDSTMEYNLRLMIRCGGTAGPKGDA